MTSMGLVHQKYKVAVVQAAPVFLDLDATVDKTIALIDQAAAQGAKLIAFPETFIPGYPWQIWLGAPAWAIGRGFVQRYFDNSLSFDSPQAEKIRKAVKRAKLTAVIGVSERDGGSLYIGQWLIGPDGETIAKRRKLRPTMPNAPCSARATAATLPSMIAPTWDDSVHCAAGSICNRCRNTRCMPRTSRFTSAPGRASHCTTHSPMRLAGKSTTRRARSMLLRAHVSSSAPARWSRRP